MELLGAPCLHPFGLGLEVVGLVVDAETVDRALELIVATLFNRDRADLGDLPQRSGWREIKPDSSVLAWTDDYSDILGAILRKKFGR